MERKMGGNSLERKMEGNSMERKMGGNSLERKMGDSLERRRDTGGKLPKEEGKMTILLDKVQYYIAFHHVLHHQSIDKHRHQLSIAAGKGGAKDFHAAH